MCNSKPNFALTWTHPSQLIFIFAKLQVIVINTVDIPWFKVRNFQELAVINVQQSMLDVPLLCQAQWFNMNSRRSKLLSTWRSKCYNMRDLCRPPYTLYTRSAFRFTHIIHDLRFDLHTLHTFCVSIYTHYTRSAFQFTHFRPLLSACCPAPSCRTNS